MAKPIDGRINWSKHWFNRNLRRSRDPLPSEYAIKRHALVQAMGLCFSVATISLGVSLGGRGILDHGLVIVSCAMVIPALIGMWLGTRVRSKIDDVV